MSRNIIYVGQIHDNSGYGVAARRNLKCILENPKANFDIKVYSQSYEENSKVSLGDNFPEIKERLISEEEISKLKSSSYELVIHLPIPTAYFAYQKKNTAFRKLLDNSSINHCLTTWETDSTPPFWDQMIQELKIVNFSVPSTWNKSVFEKKYSPIEVVPHPINTNVSVSEEPFTFESQIKDYFKVVAISQWHPRKDFETLIRSFYMAFFDNPNALLIVKSYYNLMSGNVDQDSKAIMSQIDMIKRTVFKNETDVAKCKTLFLGGVIKKEKLNRLIDISDVYMSCTRGEGFGLPISEAMCLKKPVIVPGETGHMDFVPRNNFLLEGHWDMVHTMPGYNYDSNVYYTHLNSAVKQLKRAYKMYKEENDNFNSIGQNNYESCSQHQFTSVGVSDAFYRMLGNVK